jgi:AcrR family transcriptional regulator
VTRQLGPGPVGGREPRRSGRRAGDSGTREAILAAARAQFADRGYDGATIRAIAAAAAVDPALVHHFYGSKEQLFVAAMRLPVVPSEVLTAAFAPGGRDPRVSLGEHFVRTVLGVWESEDVRGPFLGLLRSAVTSEQAAGMLREFVTEAILGPVAAAAARGLGGPGQAAVAGAGAGQARPEFRAALAASQMIGLALTRYVLALGPVATASADDLAVAIGPTLERYLVGDIHAPAGGVPGDGGVPGGSVPDGIRPPGGGGVPDSSVPDGIRPPGGGSQGGLPGQPG